MEVWEVDMEEDTGEVTEEDTEGATEEDTEEVMEGEKVDTVTPACNLEGINMVAAPSYKEHRTAQKS